MSISSRLRFEILRRDGYTCQYCGRSAPQVTLEVDHKNPRSNGGSDDPSNLATACWDCNRGKGTLHYSRYTEEDLFDLEMQDYSEHMNGDGREWLDELPAYLTERKFRRPMVFKFDIYAAATEQCAAEFLFGYTTDAVIRKAEAFAWPI